ncbi:hypothetical protein TWF718_001982 [Orbilia javanica]|uniref:Rhodopsin domain-containing protein n=1 Tax=Orbilia javanica TaxID=47235 RepID=A0AAN8RHR8_9PEZI
MEKYCDTNLVEGSVVSIRSRGKRVALFGLFGIGTFVIISTIVKIVAIAQPENFHPPELVLWSFVEACVAVVVVCLPSLPPLIWKNSRFRDVSTGGISMPGWDDAEGPNFRLDETIPRIGSEHPTNGIPSSRLSTINFKLWEQAATVVSDQTTKATVLVYGPTTTDKKRNNSSTSSISNARDSKLVPSDTSISY